MIKMQLLTKEAKFRVNKILRFYKFEFFKAMAIWMDSVRYDAGTRELVQSAYPNIWNHSILRRLQKTTPGRLTSRSGKLKFMLTEFLKTTSDFGKRYSGTSIYKWIGAGLAIRIKMNQSGITQKFIGEMRVEISPTHGRLYSRGILSDRKKRMRMETPRSLALRFNWDRSNIRGGGSRPFITPAAQKKTFNLTQLAAQRLTALSKYFNIP
jgi:hypothetical protein